MIYFLAKGGLCNRLRGIASAYQFAREAGKQPLTIIWMNNHECNCPLEKAFNIRGDIPVHVIETAYINNFRLRNLKERICKAMIRGKCQEEFIDEDVYMDKEVLIGKSCKVRNTFITSCAYWFASENPFKIFEPVESIQKSIDSICQAWGGIA